ncbi:MAG TPA: hypothetical protein VFO78_08050 [Candidatus Limnocylindrales bacterium]|nr:hypothetical protein [Candidatus Limnocylindrales bacterium]
MNASDELERRITDFYASEATPRAPEWVLEAALATVETTRQRPALRVPWRIPNMNTYAKVAVAAVAIVAVGAVGLAVLRPGSSPGVGGPIVTPSPTPAPSPSATLPPLPTPSPYEPPALTETFTSDIHGMSISYPAGWSSQAATVPWTTSSLPLFREPAGDYLYEPSRTDHLFLGIVSKALADTSFDEWAADLLGANGCPGSSAPIVVDGAAGVIAPECTLAVVSSEGRAYVFALNASDDFADLRAFDSRAWFEEILATAQLQPADAVDAAPSGAPAP